jgi:hypothetical protein
MRVLRSSLFVAATAIIAAACGDKVNVVGPSSGTGTLKIQSVVVAPNPATITAGTSVQLTAAVSADAGVTTTVVWSTTNSGVATVSQSGLVAGVSAGAVGICAAASATNAATVSGCATVNVSPAATTVNAVIQIASITTQAGGLNAPVPVPPAAVAGQINVSVNVNPGTERMDSVVVMVNGISAATQTFTGAQAAALRAAADAAADQALQQTLVFSINTAAYATAGCATQIAPCGTPTFLNGPATISVVGYGHQGATAATNTVSQGVALLFGNADSWIVAQTLGAGANTAANAAGFNFSGGQTASVSVTSVPVSYSGLGIASAVVNYGTAACDASGTAQRALTMTAPVAPSRAWTATFPRATQTAPKITAGLGVDVNNYSFNPVACAAANAAGGEGANMASALYTTNVNAPVGFALGSTIPVVRLDNLAPGAPAMVQNPNGRQNGWINGAVALTGSSAALSATSNNWTVAGAADLGVGGYTTMLRIGAPSATGTVSGVITLAGSATPTLPAPALTNLTYCAVASATDKLGNESTLPIATAVCTLPVVGPGAALAVTTPTAETFGVDIAPPTITMSAGSIAASSAGVGSTGASVGGEFQVTVLDTGAVGNSGMLAAGPVNATVTIRTAAAGLTAAQLCPVGTVTAGVCTASATGFAAPAFPFVTTNTVAAQTIIGYYTFSAVSIDEHRDARPHVQPGRERPGADGFAVQHPAQWPDRHVHGDRFERQHDGQRSDHVLRSVEGQLQPHVRWRSRRSARLPGDDPADVQRLAARELERSGRCHDQRLRPSGRKPDQCLQRRARSRWRIQAEPAVGNAAGHGRQLVGRSSHADRSWIGHGWRVVPRQPGAGSAGLDVHHVERRV